MHLKEIKRYTNMCSGATSKARIYFQEEGELYYWDELTPKKLKKSPYGEANLEVVEEAKKVLRKERAKRRFTPQARLISKALKGLEVPK